MDGKLVGGAPSSMSIGSVGTEAVVNTSTAAPSAWAAPDEYAYQGFGGGHYRFAGATSSRTWLANDPILSFRWQPPGPGNNFYAALMRVQVATALTVVLLSQQAIDVDVVAARYWTAADTNGTSPLVAGNLWKTRASMMGTSQVNALRIVGGATPTITAGTRTLDALPFGITCLPQTGVLGAASALTTLYDCALPGQHPVMLGPGEGFLVRNVTAFPASGAAVYYVIAEWAEVPGL